MPSKRRTTFFNPRSTPEIFNQTSGPWCGKRCDSPASLCSWKTRQRGHGRGNNPWLVADPSAERRRLQGFFVPTVLRVGWPDAPPDNRKCQPVAGEAEGRSIDVRTPCHQPREASPERRKRARASSLDPRPSTCGCARKACGGSGAPTATRHRRLRGEVSGTGHGCVIRAATDRAVRPPGLGIVRRAILTGHVAQALGRGYVR